ncbi:MAG TPA: S8 family serine peptidase [Thermoanaerobaculia bacterium]|nr:S8 family serine peptidase [Thermoanaerobaculia bacterium]
MLVSLPAAASFAASGKIAPEVIADTAGDSKAEVIVFLADQADLSGARGIRDHDARGRHVYNTLRQHADRTQAGIRKFLEARGISYRSFWAANMLSVLADRALVEQLAARADVARVDSNRPVRGIEDPAIADLRTAVEAPQTAEWGVQNVNAPAVWALGFTGQGIVIGGQDTGYRWTHDAIKGHYRGWNGTTADHNYNWHDAIHSGGGVCGANASAPCDDNGHGTHTIGTAAGDDGSANQIGVAPGAKWIGCRNMDQGNGTPTTYTECFEFMMAPTNSAGQNPDPTKRPHAINNSWSCPVGEGCTTRAELETVVHNTEAAGIFVEAAAQNAGPGCSTVVDPPGIYAEAFSVGAYDITNTLAGFSSRGPSTYYTPNLLKPDLSAPGVSVRSCYATSDSTYTSLSGTSMAGPHVVGVVALLWSARPQLLRDVEGTKAVLKATANPAVVVSPPQTCGGTSSSVVPNNSFGYGRVDALAAVNSVKVAPVGLAVDPSADGGFSDGNGILEPGERVFVRPSWKNNSGVLMPLTGTAGFTGPAGPVYTANDGTADYGLMVPGAAVDCGAATGDCYEITVSNPALRPSSHWDATLTESPSTGAPPKAWTIHVGSSFADVPKTHVFYPFIERILHNGVTVGCAVASFCPDDSVTRFQMAVFLSRSLAGGDANVIQSAAAQGQPYNCVSGGTSLFTDVPPDNPFCRHVHYIYAANVTTGCEPGKFCPNDSVTRAQMSLFVSRAMAGSDAAVPLAYGPDPVTGRSYSCDPASPNLHFTDVTTSDIFCRGTHFLWAKNVISGFPDGSYGPTLLVTRGAMAKFLSNAFAFKLYKP